MKREDYLEAAFLTAFVVCGVAAIIGFVLGVAWVFTNLGQTWGFIIFGAVVIGAIYFLALDYIRTGF